jgi:CHAT domain-containing protein/TPR repeat protein
MIRDKKFAISRWSMYGCLAMHAVLLIASVPARQTESGELIYGAPINARLKRGETHQYQLRLSAGQYVSVEFRALSGDITLELITTDGKKLGKMKAVNGNTEGESISAVADETSSYYVRITSRGPEQDNVEYQVRVSELLGATAIDRTRCQGIHLFVAGEEMYELRTKEGYLAAIEKYEASIPYLREADDWFSLARAIEAKGEAYFYLGKYPQALSAFEAALPLIQKAEENNKVLSLAARTTSNIGTINYRQYNMQQALYYYLLAAKLYRQLGSQRGEAAVMRNIGAIYTTTGQPEESLKWFEHAFTIQQKYDNKQILASIFYDRAAAFYFMGKYEEAIAENQRGIDLYQKQKDVGKQGFGLTAIASNYIELSQPQTALEFLDQALPLIRKGGNQSDEAFAMHFFGDSWRLLGNPTRALEYYRQAQNLRQNLNERILEAFTISKIAQTELLRGNFSEALFQSNRALDMIENVRQGYTNFILSASYSSSIHHYYEEHIALLLQQHQKQPAEGYDIQAFQTSERAQARALLESLADIGNDIRATAPPALLQREADLQKALDRKISERDKLRLSPTNASHIEKLIGIESELRQLQTEYDQVQGELRTSHPRYDALLRQRPLSPEEIREQVLPPDAVLLEYFVARDRIYLFAVTKQDSLIVVEIPDKVALEQAAASFKRRKFESDLDFQQRLSYADPGFQRTIRFLSDKLLAPIKSLLKNRKIWIVSDGSLQQIPFAALPDPTAQRKQSQVSHNGQKTTPLVAAHELTMLPSASTSAWLRKVSSERAPVPGLIALLADPVFSANDERVKGLAIGHKRIAPALTQEYRTEPDLKKALRDTGGDPAPGMLKRLPASQDEAKAIAALVPVEKYLMALGFDANREIVISGALNRFRYLHFATHAYVDDQYPQLSWLALSLVNRQGEEQNGYLRLNDILKLRLGADLVVLGACRTGLGKQLRGEGLVGLTRGFMYAGVPRVVVSLWDIPDRETAQLMKIFYRNLLTLKLSPSEALRRAQAEMWSQTRSNAPFFWAAFTLQGDPRL